MKCCANCAWSISPELEKSIMEEQGYDEEDPNRPHAGDCCLGINHEGKCVCDKHDYDDLYLENNQLDEGPNRQLLK